MDSSWLLWNRLMSNRKKYNALLRANAFFPSGDMEDPLNGEIRSMRKRKHKRKIVAASFDYDDCTDAKGFQYFRDGTVTFIRTPITEKLRPPPYGDDLNQTLEALDARFDADTEGADEVVGFVGSKRQSTRNDYFNMAMLDNGLSFPVIEQLCRERDWVFERLLYADVVFKRKPGESMKMVDMERGGISRDSAFREEISTDIKSGFIQEQLDYVSKKYPDDDITFVFYDDDYEETIFRELATNLKLPPNVSAIKLVKCDTHIGSEKVKPVIHDHTHLVRPIPYLKASIVKAIQAYIENAQKQLASLPENVPISAAERSKFHYYPSTFSTPVSKR